MADSQVRIFVSSPSDLDHERSLIKDIVDGLAQEYLPYFRLQAVLWEEEALTAAQSFQAGLVRPSECELVLVMLWTRLGTPLADDPYGGMTGTEWEFVDAVEGHARTGTPEVLVYKKTRPRLIDITDAAATHEAVADRERLEGFFRTHFFNPDGSFRRAFRQFDSDRALRELVEGQVRKLLNRRISVELGRRPGAGEWRASPFRAGRPYRLADEAVFVGRETETRELLGRLDAGRGVGPGLLLISGRSGVGKSSLVQAGLLPRLVRPFLFAGVAGCRFCLCDCAGPDPLADLARALLAPALLGSALETFGLDQGGLTRLLETEPGVAAAQVQAALGRLGAAGPAAGGAAAGQTRLALILDPLDRLLDTAALESERTQTFARALAALAQSDGVWVIATLRSDYLRHLPHLPDLAGLLDEQTWYALAAPAPARIRQVVEIPARIAGIAYEGETGRGLVELLEAEASGLEHWPLLLEPLLAALYERAAAPGADAPDAAAPDPPGAEVPGTEPTPAAARLTLRIADYRALGGVAGGVRARAEALWARLDAGARAALPRLCRALIALEGGPAARALPRAGDLRVLEADPDCADLVEALAAARLVVIEGVSDPAEQRPCACTEDALLPALARLARETGEEWRARLFPRGAGATLAAVPAADPEWEAGPGGPDGADAPGAALPVRWQDYRPTASLVHRALIDAWAPVRDWLADPANRRDLELRFQISRQARLWKRTDCNREYLLGELGFAAARRFESAYPGELEPVESDFLARSRERLRVQRGRNRLARVLGLTLVALVIAASTAAWWAGAGSRAATLNMHRSELNAANLAIVQGNTPAAVRLALAAGQALPQAAVDTLSRAFSANRLIAMLRVDPAGSQESFSPGFSADGRRVAVRDGAGGAALWTLVENRYVRDHKLADASLPIHAVRILGDREAGAGGSIVGIGTDGVWRLPRGAESGSGSGTDPGSAPESAPGSEPGSGSGTGSGTGPEPAPGSATGGPPTTAPEPAAGPVPAPDWPCGTRAGGFTALDPARRYLALPQPAADGRFGLCLLDLEHPGAPLWNLPLHRKDIRAIAFSPDGRRLVTGSRDGTALLLDTLTGQTLAVLNPTGTLNRPVIRAAFDPHGGQFALTTTDEKVRVYDAAGRETRVLGEVRRGGHRLRVHQSPVRDLAFGGDGRYLIAGDDEGQLVRWDLRDGEHAVLGQHRLAVSRVAVTPASDPRVGEPLILTASPDRTARLWGLQSGREFALYTHDGPITDARFSAEGDRVLTDSDQDGTARLWSVGLVSPLAFRLPLDDHVSHLDLARPPPELDADPRALLIAAGAFDGLVHVWRYDAGAPWAAPVERWRLTGHQGRVRRVAFSPSARRLASAGYDGTTRVWDMVGGGGCALPADPLTPAAPQTLEAPPLPEVYRVLFAPNERWILSTSNHPAHPVRLWDPAACLELPLPAGFSADAARTAAAAVGAGPDGSQFAAAGNDRGELLILRQAPGGQWGPGCRLQVAETPLTDLAFAPGGDLLAGVGEDGHLTLIPLAGDDCGEPRRIKAGAETLSAVRFAPDGAALVTASQGGTARVWDRVGNPIAELRGHQDRLSSAEFSPDGRWISTASRDGALRLWRRPAAAPPSAEGPPVLGSYLVLEADLGAARIARFAPDGNDLAAAYRQNAVVLWRIWDPQPPAPALVDDWGPERARLALIREAVRFSRDNGLDAPVVGD